MDDNDDNDDDDASCIMDGKYKVIQFCNYKLFSIPLVSRHSYPTGIPAVRPRREDEFIY